MEFIALTGLPRTGSTLLSAILSQNPEIHSEGLSPVMRMVKGADEALKIEKGHIIAGNKENAFIRTVHNIYKNYYSDINAKFVFDKHRSWIIPVHEDLIKRYIRKDPKLIIQMRDFGEIQESFRKLGVNKSEQEKEHGVSKQWYDNLIKLRSKNLPNHLWIDYNDLVEDAPKVIKSIYDFCDIPFFENHYYENIQNPNKINDNVYNIDGLHDIRSSIGFRDSI